MGVYSGVCDVCDVCDVQMFDLRMYNKRANVWANDER